MVAAPYQQQIHHLTDGYQGAIYHRKGKRSGVFADDAAGKL